MATQEKKIIIMFRIMLILLAVVQIFLIIKANTANNYSAMLIYGITGLFFSVLYFVVYVGAILFKRAVINTNKLDQLLGYFRNIEEEVKLNAQLKDYVENARDNFKKELKEVGGK